MFKHGDLEKKTLKNQDDLTESFRQLPNYFYMLEQTNYGIVTEVEVDSHNIFKYCFIELGASI